MSRFYTTSESERGMSRSHGGRKTLNVHTRGWNMGVTVIARVNEKGLDCFDIYQTSGSNELGSKRLIKTITDVYSAGPRDVKGRLK